MTVEKLIKLTELAQLLARGRLLAQQEIENHEESVGPVVIQLEKLMKVHDCNPLDAFTLLADTYPDINEKEKLLMILALTEVLLNKNKG